MLLDINVGTSRARIITVLVVAAVGALLAWLAVGNFMIGVLGDERVPLSRDSLESAVARFPNSAPLLARLAAAEMDSDERDPTGAERYARRAIEMSPWDYRHRMLLAGIVEAAGDRAGAEQLLQEAVALAPNYSDVHWRLANLLLRQGKLGKSISEFRSSCEKNSALLPQILDLLWRISGQNIDVVEAVTPPDAKARLSLAQFLLKQNKAPEAVAVFAAVDRAALISSPSTPGFIAALVDAGNLEEAHRAWAMVAVGASPELESTGIWNGGFEADLTPQIPPFDWRISSNEYVVPAVDGGTAHTGARSLRFDFLGRDTTRVDGQLTQMLVVRPASRYRIGCFIKTENFVSPDGPRVVVTNTRSSVEFGSSLPVAAGTRDWQPLMAEFKTPPDVRAVLLTVRRLPQFSYDEPTKGSIWFDDFTLTELPQR